MAIIPKRNEPKTDAPAMPAARLIDERIRSLGGWRGEMLALDAEAFKALIRTAVTRNLGIRAASGRT